MVFSTGATFSFSFFGVAVEDADADEAEDEAEAVSELRGGTFSADSVAASAEELLPAPKNSLSLPIKQN